MANIITIIRMVLSVFLIFYTPNDSTFFIIYTICGISDFLDGYIARKTNTVTDFGSKLDTIADLLFALVIVKILYSYIIKDIFIIVSICIILIIRIISVIIIFRKYNKVRILHTYLNKLTGFLIFIYGYFANEIYFAFVICIIAILSAIEELYINVTSKKLDVNKKGILINEREQ